MTPKQELIKSTDEMIKKSQDRAKMSTVIGYGGVAIGVSCLMCAIATAVRENYDAAIINGLIGALNLYLGWANIDCAKRARNNIIALQKSKQELEKLRW
ncbi:MAG: hypothetical protein J6Q44_00710 [Alphaproteobacteria bacterium]|nr:hypothetical protein [Alphaproteobacteria bacterium]